MVPSDEQSPDSELARRILSMTSQLDTNCKEKLRLPYRRRRSGRLLMVAGSAVAGIAVVLGCGAYAAGGSVPKPLAGAQWPQVQVRGVVTGPSMSRTALAQAVTMDSSAMSTLRQSGWLCPQLAAEGFTLTSTMGLVLDGRPTMAVTAAQDADRVTIYEQQNASDRDTPYNALTGHRADQDGLKPVTMLGMQVWTRPAQDGTQYVVFNANGASYTVQANVPAATMAALSSDIHAQAMAAADVDSAQHESLNPVTRIQRGMARLFSVL